MRDYGGLRIKFKNNPRGYKRPSLAATRYSKSSFRTTEPAGDHDLHQGPHSLLFVYRSHLCSVVPTNYHTQIPSQDIRNNTAHHPLQQVNDCTVIAQILYPVYLSFSQHITQGTSMISIFKKKKAGKLSQRTGGSCTLILGDSAAIS
jgi:hypothetical protein